MILAALAKDAVPQFDFAQVKNLDGGSSGAFDAALLTAKSGEHFVVRMANSASAGTELEAEIRAIKTFTPVIRLNLPFELSELVGDTQDSEGARAMVFNFVYGNPVEISRVEPLAELTLSIATSIAAIHKLPVELVQNAGFPELDPASNLKYRVSELDRAAQTGKVLHWSGLRISDPAEDLSWILGGAVPELSRNLIARYFEARPGSDSNIWPRALLYSELELARWLLHGYSTGNQEVIEDAVGMLLVLTEEVETGKAERLHAAPLATSIALAKLSSEPAAPAIKNDELF